MTELSELLQQRTKLDRRINAIRNGHDKRLPKYFLDAVSKHRKTIPWKVLKQKSNKYLAVWVASVYIELMTRGEARMGAKESMGYHCARILGYRKGYNTYLKEHRD